MKAYQFAPVGQERPECSFIIYKDEPENTSISFEFYKSEGGKYFFENLRTTLILNADKLMNIPFRTEFNFKPL